MTGKKIKVLRSDNKGEYTSKDLSDFYKEAGIERELIVPYMLQPSTKQGCGEEEQVHCGGCQGDESCSRFTHVLMGRDIQHDSLCSKQESSLDIGRQNS